LNEILNKETDKVDNMEGLNHRIKERKRNREICTKKEKERRREREITFHSS